MRKVCQALLVLSLTMAPAIPMGCSKPPAHSADLTVQLWSEPVSLDPALAEDGLSLRLLYNIMDGLVAYDEEGKLENRLAKSVTISPDGKSYTFTLREDARWSDGTPVEAQDFIIGFARALSPQSKSKLVSLLYPVRSAKSYHEGRVPLDTLGIRATGARSLVIELERATPYFLQALTIPLALPARTTAWSEDGPVTGAFRIVQHVPERKMVLERNPHYFRRAESPERVEILILQDESAAAHLFEQGKVDILTRLNPLDVVRLRPSGKIRTDPFLATYYIGFNLRKPPFNDLNWRRTVAAAIHKEELVELLGTGEIPATGWIPKGLEGYVSKPFRSKKARLPATRRLPVVAAFDGNSRNTLIFEKLQQDILRETGLRLSLQKLDWKTYLRTLQADPPPLFRLAWQAPFDDPITHLMAFRSNDPNNYGGWKNRRYDQLVERIAELVPGPARETALREAQRLLLEEDVAIVPLYHYVQNHAVSDRVSKFRVNHFGYIRFDAIELRAHDNAAK